MAFMTDILPIDEVVRRTGLSSRALRFYESRGLVSPVRTARGRRHYGAAELARIHQIQALKTAGLTLTQMRAVFDGPPIALVDLLRGQLDALSQQAKAIDTARTALSAALARIEKGAAPDAVTLCALIRDGESVRDFESQWKPVIDRYWSPEAQTQWLDTMAPLEVMHPGWDQDAYQAQWRDLSDRIASAMPMDPSSDTARGFLREWWELLAPISSVATPEMWDSTKAMYDDRDNWPTDADPGFSKPVWDFILECTRQAMADGFAFGPLPPWMASAQHNQQHSN